MKGNATKLLRALVPAEGHLGALTVAELRAATSLTSMQIREAADSLIARELATRSARGMLRITTAGLLKAASGATITSGPNGPKATDERSTFRNRVWRALRMLSRFTVGDVVRLAANGSEANAQDHAYKYVEALARAGILSRLPHRREKSTASAGCRGHSIYVLANDLGPKAPHWNKRTAQVSDPNHGEVFHA